MPYRETATFAKLYKRIKEKLGTYNRATFEHQSYCAQQ